MNQRPSSDEGFTLIELMISIAILGIIMVPLVGSFTLAMIENTSSRERTADATSAQLISTLLQSDIQSSCVPTSPRTATTPCGAGTVAEDVAPFGACMTTEPAKLELRWVEPGAGRNVVVDYYVATTADGQLELHRAQCVTGENGGLPDDTLLALNLEEVAGAGSIFDTTCTTDGAEVACTGAPDTVSVHVVAKSVRVRTDKGSYAPFEFTFEATRRAGAGS